MGSKRSTKRRANYAKNKGLSKDPVKKKVYVERCASKLKGTIPKSELWWFWDLFFVQI